MHPPAPAAFRKLTRRGFMATGAAAATLATANTVMAQQAAPRVKGPRVWLDMD